MDGPEEEGDARRAVSLAVRRFLAAGLLVLVAVAVPSVLWINHTAERLALDEVTGLTQRLADYALGPAVDEALLGGDPAARAGIRQILDPWVDSSYLVRIKIWRGDGTVLYSDEADLIGQRFELGGDARAVLASGRGQATYEEQNDVENLFEAGQGSLVEVYVASEASTGEPLLFEAYYAGEVVDRTRSEVLAGAGPLLLVALVVLQLAQLLPAIGLARRVHFHQEERRLALQHAVDAGQLERARIARDIHDDVIQDLAGLGYALEAAEADGGAQARGRAAGRAPSEPASAVVRRSVRTLRDITGTLYAPQIEPDDLPDALYRLGAPLAERGIAVDVSVRPGLRLDQHQATVLYRVAREALVNIAKHAGASHVWLDVDRHEQGTAMVVADDGRGIEGGAAARHGHLGLRIMHDIAATAGGRTEVAPRAGGGTSVSVVFDQPGAGAPPAPRMFPALSQDRGR